MLSPLLAINLNVSFWLGKSRSPASGNTLPVNTSIASTDWTNPAPVTRSNPAARDVRGGVHQGAANCRPESSDAIVRLAAAPPPPPRWAQRPTCQRNCAKPGTDVLVPSTAVINGLSITCSGNADCRPRQRPRHRPARRVGLRVPWVSATQAAATLIAASVPLWPGLCGLLSAPGTPRCSPTVGFVARNADPLEAPRIVAAELTGSPTAR